MVGTVGVMSFNWAGRRVELVRGAGIPCVTTGIFIALQWCLAASGQRTNVPREQLVPSASHMECWFGVSFPVTTTLARNNLSCLHAALCMYPLFHAKRVGRCTGQKKSATPVAAGATSNRSRHVGWEARCCL